MMILIVSFSCTIALFSGVLAQHYNGPIHIPVIGDNGVPIEPPEVRAARANHMAAHAAAKALALANPDHSDFQNPENDVNNYQNYIQPIQTPQLQPSAPWPGPYAQVAPNGTPLDTPEVQAAKHQHFADFWDAARRNSIALPQPTLPVAPYAYHQQPIGPVQGHWRRRRSAVYPHAYPTLQKYPVIGPDGQPFETPEVQEAKARHFDQFQRESARNSANSYHQFAPFQHYQQSPQVNMNQFSDISQYQGHQAVPSEHQHAFQQALAAHPLFGGRQFYNNYPQPVNNFPQPVVPAPAPAGHNPLGYFGEYHYPVIGPGGVPTEPPAVQQARDFHLATHAKAKIG